MYIPPSDRFHLTINAKIKSFNFKTKVSVVMIQSDDNDTEH